MAKPKARRSKRGVTKPNSKALTINEPKDTKKSSEVQPIKERKGFMDLPAGKRGATHYKSEPNAKPT